MKKILVFFFSTFSLFACSPLSREEAIKQTILDTERAEIPILLQEFENVFDIQIDSVVLTNNTNPYSGYLVTIWDLNEKQNTTVEEWYRYGFRDKYVRKTKTVLVPLRGITVKSLRKVEWFATWQSVYYDVRRQADSE